MKRFFVPLYKYFAGHKSLMWTLAAVLSVFSVFFGLKVGYEEDITKLLPASATSDSGLAFGNLKVKDKIFIQFASRDSLADTYTLASYPSIYNSFTFSPQYPLPSIRTVI